MTPPSLPPGVLVQSLYVTDEGEESGWRVWEDGTHESRRLSAPWAIVSTLDDAALAAVRSALDGADLAGMAGVHSAGEGPRQLATLWFQAVSRGTPFTVALAGGARLEALDALTAELIAALAGPGGFPPAAVGPARRSSPQSASYLNEMARRTR